MRRAPRPSVMDSTGSVGPTVMRRQFFWTYKVKTGNCEVVKAPADEQKVMAFEFAIGKIQKEESGK